MKNIKAILLIAFLALSFSATAQKVKFKRGKVLIDKVETYEINNESTVTSFSTLNGKEFVSVVYTSYEEPNPASKMPHTGYIPPTLKKTVSTVKFLESGKEMVTNMSNKKLIKAIYKAEMVDADGNIDEDKLNIFINKYNNENLKYKLVN